MALGQIQVALSGQGAGRENLDPDGHRYVHGQLVYAKPQEIDLPEKPGPVIVWVQVQKMLKTAQRSIYSMLGPLVDSEGG